MSRKLFHHEPSRPCRCAPLPLPALPPPPPFFFFFRRFTISVVVVAEYRYLASLEDPTYFSSISIILFP
jgi:hypothetical protein